MRWEQVPLRTVTVPVSKWQPKTELNTTFRYIDLRSVNNAHKRIENATQIVGSEAPSRARQLVAAGDVIVSTVRPNLNAVAEVTAKFDQATASTGFSVLRPDDMLSSTYLFHWVRTPAFANDMAQKATGASYPAVSDRIIKDSLIQLPPMAEQRRISAILDEADKVQANRRALLAHLDELPHSLFHAKFSDPINNPLQLPTQKLGELATIVTGNTPSRASRENYGGTLEWVKSNNLGDLRISKAAEFLSEHGRIKARVADAGSVLVTCIAGSPESIGKASIADRTVAFNQQINAILPSPNLDPMFLYFQLQTAPDLVRAKSTGGMKGLVSKSSFASISVLCPPIAEQRSFAEKVEAIQEERDRVERALEVDEELFAALQYRAFRGEL